jgi:hypothetical protein
MAEGRGRELEEALYKGATTPGTVVAGIQSSAAIPCLCSSR